VPPPKPLQPPEMGECINPLCVVAIFWGKHSKDTPVFVHFFDNQECMERFFFQKLVFTRFFELFGLLNAVFITLSRI